MKGIIMKQRKERIKKFKLTNAIIYVLLCLLIFVIIMVFSIKQNINKIEFKDINFYQYLSSNKFEYNGKVLISIDDKNNTVLNNNQIKVNLDATPIYYAKEKSLFLPKDMSIIFPNNFGLHNKVNHFSSITLKDNNFYVKNENYQKQVTDCFLFDGEDLYLFLDKMTFTIGKDTYVIEPFSYIILDYQNSIQIYDYKNDIYRIINLDKNDIIATSSKGYKVNLSIDSISYDKYEQLLLKKIDILNNL
jgi:biopolymer transport protein ExbD